MLCAALPQLHRVRSSPVSDTLSALLLYVSPQLVTCRAGCFRPKMFVLLERNPKGDSRLAHAHGVHTDLLLEGFSFDDVRKRSASAAARRFLRD